MRGRGFLIGIELVSDREAKTPARDLTEEVFYRLLDGGLSCKITMGNVLTWTPSLVTTEAEMDWAVDLLDEVLATGD